MINLDVLAIGNFQKDPEGRVFDAFSTSTLIRTADRMIVVDTSAKYMRPGIKISFKKIGVFPKDVDTVILTHSHKDHIENNDLFENAEILMHPNEHGFVEGAKPLVPGKELASGIRVIHTPGHTAGSVSVFVDADRKYAIVGDAIPKRGNFEKMTPPAINTDADLALQSLKTITKYADMIIPGHDPPFLTNR